MNLLRCVNFWPYIYKEEILLCHLGVVKSILVHIHTQGTDQGVLNGPPVA